MWKPVDCMFKHSIKWVKKYYGHGRSGPSSHLELHLPYNLPSPRHLAVILSTKPLVDLSPLLGCLNFSRLHLAGKKKFLPFTWPNLLPLRLSLKVWPVIWLKLNDIQEISGERQTQQGPSVGKPTWKVRNYMNGEELWALASPPLNNHFLLFPAPPWSRSCLQSSRQRRNVVAGKGCRRRIVFTC